MTFLHLWALGIGGAAIGLPLLIHWLTRPRPRRLSLSTVRFVHEAIQERRARHRLRDAVILSLRILAVLLLAWAFARPRLGRQPLIAPDQPGRAVRVVVLDCSQSMAARTGGVDAFERARALAARFAAAPAGVRTNLIFAAARPKAVFEKPSSSFAGLQDALAAARPLPQRLNIKAAAVAAARMFEQVPADSGTRRELVIISDFQRSNWAEADFSVLPQDTLIQLESVAPAQTPANLAVLRVGGQRRPEQGRPTRLEVEIGNFSPAPREVHVDLTLGEASYHLSGLAAPGVRTVLSTEVAPESAGWQIGEARLTGVEDALAEDNRRPFVVSIRPPPVLALLTRESADPRPTSSHFLERALAPSAGRIDAAREKVLRLSPAQFDQQVASATDMVVLDHPGKLSVDSIQLLAGLLRRGRPMLYVAAEPIDAANLKLLSQAAGPDLKMPVEFVPAAAGAVRHDLFLAEMRADQPPFAILGDGAARAATALRFSTALGSRHIEGGLADDVAASYSDRSAFLVISPCGAGVLAVLNVDLANSNLRSSPVFVPLVGELTSYLLSQGQDQRSFEPGEPLAVYLPPQAGVAAGLRIAGPSPALEEMGTLTEDNGRVLWNWTSPGAAAGPAVPGVYRIQRGETTVFAVACELPAEESDLHAIEPSVLQQRLAGGRQVYYRAADELPQEADPLWTVLATACAICLLAEMVALRWFRT